MEDDEGREEEEEIMSCDVCEYDFYSQEEYEQHVSEHKVCGLEGCQFTACESVIEYHIGIQHSTGLYDKIRNVSTPEDIAKWREERRVRYPSKENVQKRYEQQEEMLKRGEKIGPRKNRFGKDRTRCKQFCVRIFFFLNKIITVSKVTQQRRPPRKRRVINANAHRKPVKKESLIVENCDWNGSMPPFRGTKELFEETVDRLSDYEDEEWTADVCSKVEVPLNNALGALMGAYLSDSEAEDATPQTGQIIISDNDAEAPIEKKIDKHPVAFPGDAIKTTTTNPKENADKVVKNRKRRAVMGGKKRRKVAKVDKNEQSVTINELSRLKFVKRRATLLEKLLDSEIRHERNILLQCVQYVVSNNFFRDK